MNKKLSELEQQRKYLIRDSEYQREQIVQVATFWRDSIALIDTSFDGLSLIKKHPFWFASGGVILLLMLRHTRLDKFASRCFIAWQFIHELKIKFLRLGN